MVPSGTASAAKSHLTQSLPLSPGSPYPNTGWRQGPSLINRRFNKPAVIDKFQLRVCFPGNPTWNNSLDQNRSPKGLDAALVFTPLCFCPGHRPGMSSSTYPSGKIQLLHQGLVHMCHLCHHSPRWFPPRSGLPEPSVLFKYLSLLFNSPSLYKTVIIWATWAF